MTPRSVLSWLFVLPAFALGATGCASTDEPANQNPGDGGYVGPAGCSAAPDCAQCSACFDSCLCNNGTPGGCLAQCSGSSTGGTSGSGGAPAGGGGAPAGGGAPSGGGAPAGGGGSSGGGNCTALSTGSPTCDACAHSTCCSQIDGCLANSACTGFLSCLSKNCANAGSNLSACAQQYCSQYSSGVNAYNAMAQCIGQSCASSC